MQIGKNTVVSLSYEMFDANNELLDRTVDEPMVYLHGGYDGIFPLVEEALQGKKVGEKIDVTMEPEDAFGEYEPELVRKEAKDVFPPEVEVGMMFEADDPESGEIMIFTVTEMGDNYVTVDGNHPLAGKTVRFVGTVTDVRAASEEELEHGHAHGPHDHHHH
ncbi:FKBP-type peptidyl-prolyl cis-trans isomerase [Parachitinimonas caeni]|uniref:Peptidyl-prolyl cis-trans isomerase n=1 Tax=Parachitinimonas caeni TaxID=3031301 RepID=A0ABT7E024_9NEIS|nr:peptidylprolyl isomerase [Parachitinimonas caeni]MDK2125658.1 peptidylprolyl isomerase [Parachitinimonas caeni]